MRKKYILLTIVLIISLLIFSSCGNRQVGIDTSQTFNKAYVRLGNEWKIVTVRNWRDFQDGDEVQITTTDGDVYLSHYSNIMLVNSK